MCKLQDSYIYFENGLFIKAKSFGASGTSVGEVVFNTSMSGYQEILSDPSYAGQFVAFSMPEIGIVGTNAKDSESSKASSVGIIISSYNDFVSNFRSEQSLGSYLIERGIMGLCNVDTRGLIKMLTKQGAMMMIASTEISDKKKLATMLESSPNIQEIDYIKQVSTTKPYIHADSVFEFANFDYAKPTFKAKIIALDFGIKRNILNELSAVGLEVCIMPHTTKAKDIIAKFKNKEISGVFLSNGPGDPLMLDSVVAEIKELIKANIPIFGICLGHQLLSIAHGFKTYKLKFGHHGGNHPIKDMATNTIEITAQNHNYCVPEEICSIANITHRNLFDNTIEGLEYINKPIFSIQHHPESSPGPKDSSHIFTKFAKMCFEAHSI